MKGFTTLLVVSIILTHALALDASTINDLINQKSKLIKEGKNPILKIHGPGISDGQETLVLNIIDQAEQLYGPDLYQNAVFIQQKVEDAFSGRWAVEIFGGDPSWGRATYIRNEQWILLFGHGIESWDYIIWAPDC